MKNFGVARYVVVVAFGLVFPVLILAGAYQGVRNLADEVSGKRTPQEILEYFEKVKRSAATGNDYPLFALMFSESANQTTMINKQIMKVATMQVGFALVSVGLMFIVLGISDGDTAASADAGGLKFDFKTGSTGMAATIIGAVIAAAAGTLKNDYETVPIPGFALSPYEIHRVAALQAYTVCKNYAGERMDACFSKAFYDINKDFIP